MRVLLVHNPSAGSAENDATDMMAHIRRAGHDVYHCPREPSWHQCLERRPDMVAVVGGDGTVGEVARMMTDRPIPIGLLPMGTANNIATSLGLDGISCADLVASWVNASPQPFDVGVARGPWGTFRFLESVGAGLLSEAMAAIDVGWASHVNTIEHTEQRIAAAFAIFRHTLLEISSSYFELILDGQDLSGEYLLVEALNFGAAGPNLLLARHANYSDGLLDLVLVEEHRRHVLREDLELFRSDPRQAPTLRVHQGRHLELRCDRCLVHLDDDLWETDTAGITIDLSIEPGALTFLVPPMPA